MKRKIDFIPSPVVCCAGDNYIICVPTPVETLLKIRVGNSEFFCDDNGVRKSGAFLQKIIIPRKLLDEQKKYDLTVDLVKERKPYFSELYDEQIFSFCFNPVTSTDNLKIAYLSDVHGDKKNAVETGRFLGDKLDLLILNGDISSSSNTVKEVLLPFEIAFEITKGEIPCIITRGNHDLRGKLAEKLSEIYPTDNGKTYYTVDFNGLSFIVLDCGEDKNDTDDEYGKTVSFHSFRQKETEFLRELAETNDDTFLQNKKIILAHIPFMYKDKNPKFNIEEDIYSLWCSIIREHIKPVFGLFGHVHFTAFFPKNDPFDCRSFGSPIVLGGCPVNDEKGRDVEGTLISLYNDRAELIMSGSNHSIKKSFIILF